MSAVQPVSRDHRIPTTATSHPENPIPEEPEAIPREYELSSSADGVWDSSSSLTYESGSPSESEGPNTPLTAGSAEAILRSSDEEELGTIASLALPPFKKRRASTRLLATNPQDVRRLLGDDGGTKMIGKVCCGGGCCFDKDAKPIQLSDSPLTVPENAAFKSLKLKLGNLCLDTELSGTAEVPCQTVYLEKLESSAQVARPNPRHHPPKFVHPHHPYEVFSARVQDARELTGSGAEKRTYHFDLDVTDYPEEGGNVDFVVGGAIGVCPSNPGELVDEVFDILGVPNFVRNRQVRCRTTGGRWPTIWGDDQPRELITTRTELLTWCSDLQSYPPNKQFLRLLAEYAIDPSEKKILTYLVSSQGQAAFCDLRTGPYITVTQLLRAFPSSKPPLDHLLSVLNTLMPRFYSLSHDPQVTCQDGSGKDRRCIEIAVTVHDMPDYQNGTRTGVGSGFLERTAQNFIKSRSNPVDNEMDIRVPMFRGLMANPLAKEFVSDGPMLLVGAGVGIAPFRGFVQRRLKSANCANKVWVLQGIRDSLVDELYRGEWGVEEEKVKKVVQSRAGKSRYVQDEVRHQADLVWFIVNAIDGRIFVCGSTKGMGEGVEAALVDVAMQKGNLNHAEAVAFWNQKKDEGQYIAETW